MKFTAVWSLILAGALHGQSPLPALRIEPTGGGSVFYVKNVASQPVTGYLIELVNYPGSSFAFWQDDLVSPLEPGVEKRFPVTNMTVGAVPDYVKVQAAIYADGTTAGITEKVAQLLERRRGTLQTTRELIRRLSAAGDAASIKASLNEWGASFPSRQPARSLIRETVSKLDSRPVADVLAELRASEKRLSDSKPPL